MGVRIRFHRGAWWVFIAHHGRRRSKRVGDKATAQHVAKRIRERLALGDFALLGTETATFATFAANWLTTGAGARKASTQRFYQGCLALYLTPALGPVPIANITRAHCRQVIAAARAKGLRVASVRAVQRALSAVLSQAVEDGYLPANPAFRMGQYLRRGDESRREIEPFTRVEAHHFLTVVQEHWPDYHVLFLCALRAGLRLGELLGLQWADLDLAGRFIRVQHNRVGRKLTSTKNHQQRRVDMSAKLAEAFEAHLRTSKATALKAGRRLPVWVFANADGGPLDGDNLRRRVFEKALTKAKLRHIRLHDLRHTFASHLIANGESLAYVRDQMGHSSITVTVDTYGHLVPGSNRAAVDRLDAVPGCIPAASDANERDTGTGAK